MNLLVIDSDGGVGLDLASRAKRAGHNVQYWSPPRSAECGVGIVKRAADWESEMNWAELIVLTGNEKYTEALAPYFGKGYPIFGANARAAELELDREVGQKVLKEHGISILPYSVVKDLDEAIRLVKRTREAYAIKPWGGETDKTMTCVARDADEAVFMLEKWKAEGLHGQLMLQEKVDGIEMGISGFFGPGGWSRALEESFEHKKFMNDDLGCNTGEMGTVIRHVKKSKLFDSVLDPLTDYLHTLNYVGDCSVNCIIDSEGRPWPLEFTMRLGWPDFCIRQALVKGDPIEWMADLLEGRDTLRISSEVAVGVLLSHGDFPKDEDPKGTWSGFPVQGVTEDNVHLQDMMMGKYKTADGERSGFMTAGNYPLIVTGTGATVSTAQKKAYRVAESIKMPSNLMYRTDIGDRLKADLPVLHDLGYAVGMEY